MHTFVFVFESADPVTHITGIDSLPSYLVKSDDLSSAIDALVAADPFDCGPTREEILDDIDNGNISVHTPRTLS